MLGDDKERWQALGDFIRTQRQLRELSVRQLAALAKVSNPYLSQLERGMYRPSGDVLKNIAEGLRVSTETMLEQAGLLNPSQPTAGVDVERAVRLDPHLTTEQKQALLSVYRGFRGRSDPQHRPGGDPPTKRRSAPSPSAAARKRARRPPPAR